MTNESGWDTRPDEILAYLADKMQPVPLNDTHKMRRVFARHLIKWSESEYPGVDPLVVARRLINIAVWDPWHRRNAMSISYIYRHRGKLVLLGLEQKEKKRQATGGSGYRVVFE